jgi:hypothetical protein
MEEMWESSCPPTRRQALRRLPTLIEAPVCGGSNGEKQEAVVVVVVRERSRVLIPLYDDAIKFKLGQDSCVLKRSNGQKPVRVRKVKGLEVSMGGRAWAMFDAAIESLSEGREAVPNEQVRLMESCHWRLCRPYSCPARILGSFSRASARAPVTCPRLKGRLRHPPDL